MQAIVLTCDKYHPLTHHMILTYERVWPNHPFRFNIPYQIYPDNLKSRWGDRVHLIRTDPGIRQTVLTLLERIEDNEWVYWCIDDKYLVRVNVPQVNIVLQWINDLHDEKISGVSFARSRHLLKKEHLFMDSVVTNEKGQAFFRRRNYSQIWLHQFLRANVLKTLFARLPDRPFEAKEMDRLVDDLELPEDQQLFVMERNQVIFGESTRKGALTENCVNSFRKYNLSIPRSFPTCGDKVVIGRLGWPEKLRFWIGRIV